MLWIRLSKSNHQSYFSVDELFKICIYIYRERERYIHTYTYMYVCICLADRLYVICFLQHFSFLCGVSYIHRTHRTLHTLHFGWMDVAKMVTNCSVIRKQMVWSFWFRILLCLVWCAIFYGKSLSVGRLVSDLPATKFRFIFIDLYSSTNGLLWKHQNLNV